MTPQTAITKARDILQDNGSLAAARESDAVLLGHFNDAIREISKLAKSLFIADGAHVCTLGPEQSLSFATAAELIDVKAITSGNALTEFDVDALDAYSPTWRKGRTGVALQWARKPGSPIKFLVYPPAAAGQSLDVSYVAIPTPYSLNQTVTIIPDIYEPAIVDYIVHRSESKDDEHVTSGRAAAFLASFVAKINPERISQ